ncbi:MAG: mitofilin family membrane protein, partial [Pseudomonadota bacterium]
KRLMIFMTEIDEIEQEIIEEKKSISRLKKFVILFFLVTVIISSAFYLSENKHVVRQSEDSSVFDVRIENIEKGILSQEKRIAKIEEELKNKPKAPIIAPAPTPQIAQPNISNEAAERISSIEKDVASIKAANPLRDNKRVMQSIKLLSSFHRLNEKVLSGKAFAGELSAFQEEFNDNSNKSLKNFVGELTVYADSGLPTSMSLLAAFDDSLEQLKVSDAIPPENAGLFDRMIYSVTHLVTIRKIDKNAVGNTNDAIIARAEAFLEQEEVEAAVAEIKSLPDNTRNIFTNFLNDAQISINSGSIMAGIEDEVMKKSFYTTENDDSSK